MHSKFFALAWNGSFRTFVANQWPIKWPSKWQTLKFNSFIRSFEWMLKAFDQRKRTNDSCTNVSLMLFSFGSSRDSQVCVITRRQGDHHLASLQLNHKRVSNDPPFLLFVGWLPLRFVCSPLISYFTFYLIICVSLPMFRPGRIWWSTRLNCRCQTNEYTQPIHKHIRWQSLDRVRLIISAGQTSPSLAL